MTTAHPGGMGPGPRARLEAIARRKAEQGYARYVKAPGARYFKRPALHTSLWLIRLLGAMGAQELAMQVDRDN